MFSHVYLKEIEEVFRTPIIQQTAFWSRVKQQLGVYSMAVNIRIRKSDIVSGASPHEYIMADMLVLLQQLSNEYSIAYVPYGPEIDPGMENRGAFLEEISEQMRSFLPSGCIMIRYDLAWESFWAMDQEYYDANGYWLGPPSHSSQEFRFNFGTQFWNLKKAGSNMLPSNTVFVDLKKDENSLLNKMKVKTRYNIGLSERKGVTVRSVGMEQFDVWYNLYAQTAARNSFYLHNADYFRVVLTARANNTQSPADVLLLVAEMDNMPLAAMFLVISGNRATYLYGASSDNYKNCMATYALQWKAIQLAKEKNCTEYDLFGVAPKPEPAHPMYGLYRFKTGFGGELYHGMGCWDYPLQEEAYRYYSSVEMKSQGYHLS
jgi:lipid II:glycine glycyltransferase (peptidoglycan interpeptide bridge formation enzyme)